MEEEKSGVVCWGGGNIECKKQETTWLLEMKLKKKKKKELATK